MPRWLAIALLITACGGAPGRGDRPAPVALPPAAAPTDTIAAIEALGEAIDGAVEALELRVPETGTCYRRETAAADVRCEPARTVCARTRQLCERAASLGAHPWAEGRCREARDRCDQARCYCVKTASTAPW